VRVLERLERAGVPATRIGRATEPETGLRVQTPRGTKPLPVFERDEVARTLEA